MKIGSYSLFIQVHIKQECSLAIIACPNGCGEKIPKKDVSACMLERCYLPIRVQLILESVDYKVVLYTRKCA